MYPTKLDEVSLENYTMTRKLVQDDLNDAHLSILSFLVKISDFYLKEKVD